MLVDVAASTQINTFLICASAIVAYFLGKAAEMLGEGRKIPEKGGTLLGMFDRNLRNSVDERHDPIELMIDRAR